MNSPLTKGMQMTDTKTNKSTTTPAKKPAGRMESALATARGAVNDAAHETRKAAATAAKAVEANPLAVVAGGIALGVAIGALLPRSKRETELLGPTGKKLNKAAADAAGAARDAAKAELVALPLSKQAVRDQAGKVLDTLAKAVSSAGDAALNTGATVENAPKKPAKKAK